MAATTKTITSLARHLFRPRLCFLGAPGSGKGSYGKILSNHWGTPLVSVSDVLKRNEACNHAIASGQLVKDDIVSQAIVDYLAQQQETSSFLLDGFPRTISQVQLMKETWPQQFQIQAAVHLNVPLEVCEQKLLGRRICKLCGNHYNIHGVLTGGFDLPPKLPRPGECHRSGALGTPSLPQQHNLTRCDPNVHWVRRDDDQQHIIHHRLQIYQEHTQPILEWFEQEGSLFSFVPYRGFQDMPEFQSKLEEWLMETFPASVLEDE